MFDWSGSVMEGASFHVFDRCFGLRIFLAKDEPFEF